MEPVSFAVGIIGLAGLFSTCLDAVERFDSWRDYDSEFRPLVAQFKAQKLRLTKWGLAVGLEDDELSYEHNALLDDPKIESTVQELLLAIHALCRDEDKAFLEPMLGKDEKPTKDQLSHRHAIRESKRQKLGWVLRTKAKRVAQVDQFSKLVETLHNLIPIEGAKEHKGRKPTGDRVSEADAWKSELKDMLKNMETQIEDECRRDLHAWLLSSTSTNDLYEIFSQRKIEGTCEWVLSQHWFIDWTSPDFPSGRAKVLWINGPAGFGKSVLCARVIDHLSSNSNDPVAHFFFSSDFESRRNPFIAIRSWLSQMIRNPDFFSLARERLTMQQGQRATRGDTLKLLREFVTKIPRCTFVLDGLDECRWVEQDHKSNDGASIVDFLDALKQAIAGTSTRLLVVSRDEPEIRVCLVNESNPNEAIIIQHSITPEDVRPDLDVFSRSIVNKKLSAMTDAIKSDISQKLAECCNGQFLWVQMQESQLHDWKRPKQLEKAINSTPPGLDKTYDREWMGISNLSEDDREQTIALLRWTAFALRPLSVCEIAGALLISADCDEVRFDEAPDRISESFIKAKIMRLCGSLIDIRSPQLGCDPGSRTLHLAHFTVKEYLVCNLPVPGTLLQLNSSLKFSIEGTENTLAAKMCLCYVNCEEVWKEVSEKGRKQILGSFRDYAAGSWYQHASFGNMRDPELLKSVNKLFDIENPNWASWKGWLDLNDESQKMRCFDNTELADLSMSENKQTAQATSMSPLYYAAWLDLTDTMDLLLQSKNCSINELGNFGRTPLIAACERGNLKAAKKLLEYDADLEMSGDNEHTPLHAAACNGHAEVVKLLLEKGARIRNGSDGSRTPLYCACSNGHHQVAQMLLQREPEMIATHEGLIPLVAASEGGFLDIVQLLIQKGADISASDSFRETPLYVACENGHIEVVRLLLDKGADVHYQGPFGYSPMHNASSEGFSEIVLLLIDRGAYINALSEFGDTPLYFACYSGHIEVVRILLEAGAEVHHWNQHKDTAVNAASYTGHLHIVLLLIDKGADINLPNDDGETPLFNACHGGHIDIVRNLVAKGVDLEIANKLGLTPLNVASKNGFLDVIAVLLEMEAALESADVGGRTPLHRASWNGFLNVTDLLLERGADVASVDKDGFTPLHLASLSGSIEVITLLLEKGAAVNSANFEGRTPLHLASWNGRLNVANILLRMGADVASVDKDGLTPLYAALFYDFEGLTT
ncbi:NACHT nucleoside triphosphatase [Penicillium italicum]|uniref:NACHT nucleoside triphosphatase n=1 Tax=Penicillium italicum TaxID=40296 RepID=A0A0A2LAA3_PENIT|nr:NACHT nucleoside triphosphatase [Penicillium italicum]